MTIVAEVESTLAEACTVNSAHFFSWFSRVFFPQNALLHVRHRTCAPGSRVRHTARHTGGATVQWALACLSAVVFVIRAPQMRHVSFGIGCITPERRKSKAGCAWPLAFPFSLSTQSAFW